jgi:molybdopterin converting factor small subunit
MKISLKLLATYREKLPKEAEDNICIIKVQEGANVEQVLNEYGIPMGNESVVLVNGQPAGPDVLLQENDLLCAFPAMAGG